MADTATLEAKWTQAIQILHGLAASLADSKQRYDATHDERYLRSVENVFPLYRQWVNNAQDIARQLSGKEMPSQLLLTLDSTSDWLIARGKDVGEGITATVKDAPTIIKFVAVAVAIAALAYITGQAGPLLRAVKGR